jgi:hypothetical protein
VYATLCRWIDLINHSDKGICISLELNFFTDVGSPFPVKPPVPHTAFSTKSVMQFKNLLQVVQSCDKFPYDHQQSSSEYHSTVPFRVGPHVVGRLLPSTLPKLGEYNDRFSSKPFEIKESSIEFAAWVDSFDKRTEVMKQLADTWREEKTFVALAGKCL